MDKSRDGDRGDKSRGSGIPQGLDPVTAALYANMFGAAGGLGAYAAAAAMQGMQLPPSYSQVSTSAGLASLAAAQQAQQQAAALASLGPSAAAWYNLAGMQQMELLSRLQGAGMGGMGAAAYSGLHPEHLMSLELLQAQHAMTAALSASAGKGAGTSRTSSNSSSNSGSASATGGGATPTSSKGSRSLNPSSSRSGSLSNAHHNRSSRDHLASLVISRSSGGSKMDSDKGGSSRLSAHHSLDSHISVRSDLGVGGSSGLSYGIASLIADKHPSHHRGRHSLHPVSAHSEATRSKELEIIPLPAPKGSRESSYLGSSSNGVSTEGSVLAAHLSSRGLFRHQNDSPSKSKGGLEGGGTAVLPAHIHNLLNKDKGDVKVSISNATSRSGLTNGLSTASMSTPQVSIEPLSSSGGTSKSGSSTGDDAPLNLSLKPTSSKPIPEKSDKGGTSKDPTAELLNKLKPPINPYDYGQSLSLSLVPPDMAPSLDVLQSLYGHGQSRDILTSMQDALQRQLLLADSKKRDDRRKRPRTNSLVDDIPREDRARHLGRGISKPKKNTVASLLEHCRAAGIKPQLPLPPSAEASSADTPISSLAPTSVTTSPPQLSSSPMSPSTASGKGESTSVLPPIASSSPLPATPPSSLPPSLIPLFPPSISATFATSRASPALPLHTSAAVTSTSTSCVSPSSLSSLLSSSSSIPSLSFPLSLPPSLSISTSPSPSLSGVLGEANSLSNKEEHRVQITPVSSQSRGSLEASRSSLPAGFPFLHNSYFGVRNNLEISDDSDSDDISTDSSMEEDETHSSVLQPWLKTDSPDGHSRRSGSPLTKKRKMITDESSLRVPLVHGWKRETTMRGITQSGVRGEVVYIAPCGKSFKQYPDIIRYLERQNIMEISRDNFSFSSKIPVGDYIDAATQQPYTEAEVRDIVSNIRARRGLRIQHEKQMRMEAAEASSEPASIRSGRDALELEAEAILRRLEAEEKAEKAKQNLLHRIEEHNQFRVWKEQEKMKKQEDLRREKEEQRKQREEINRHRLYEQLRKAQEREQEKQKQKILKEQLYLKEMSKQREMLYNLELERERRRYHGILVRTLETRKRYEEREKKREVIREEKKAFKERKREERQAARELNLLLKEVKEDMELTDHQPLPDVPHLKGLKLPPEAFGNVLMIFEFLHNFGETLGFDMESLPSLQSLQLALLGDHESEEELLNVISHLMVCAIEDPGIPNSQRNTTILNQTLNKADIVSTNISEILRVYLYANATGEVRTVHGLHGTEKERRETPSKGREWEDRLMETESYRMSIWLQKLPLTSLTATQKGAIVSYVCNELLQNKAVVRQIEDSLDRHNGLKTHKWKLDARIRSLCRRLKMGLHRKRLYNTPLRAAGMDAQRGEDSNLSGPSWGEEKEEDEEHADDSGAESEGGLDESHVEEEDKNLNPDEATQTLESLQKQMDSVRQELFETAQQVRGYNCGQDRYQRTMWVLPHAGGPYLEGLSSCDYTGRNHFPLKIPPATKKVGFSYEEVNSKKRKLEEEQVEEPKPKVLKKEEIKEEPEQVKKENEEDQKMVNGKSDAIKEENDDEPKKEKVEENSSLKVEKEKSPEREMNETKESSTTTASLTVNSSLENIDKDLVATGLGLIPGQYLRPEHVAQYEKLSFDLIPKSSCDMLSLSTPTSGQDGSETSPATSEFPFSPSMRSNASTPLTSMTPLLQQSLHTHNMSHKELLEKLHQTAEALPISAEYKTGWWNITDLELLKQMVKSLNDRGARERELKRFLERNFSIVQNAVSKVDPNIMNFEEIIEEEENVLYDQFGTPAKDNPDHWRMEEALRVDLLALDTVFALEEKITNASMQNKNWKLGDVNCKQQEFLPSCMCSNEEKDANGEPKMESMSINDEWDIINNPKNPIHVGRFRLLSLEDGIERRYLKPPLGQAVGGPAKSEASETKCLEPTKGLHTWQEAVAKCENAAQLNMCSYMLETAVAWDKSIMKAYCQFCHSGDFEEKLLLCDGCDKGYHMHCFRPPMENIPEGDWYCYECVNKFSDSGHRHCLACGGVDGKTLVHCVSCPRAYHTSCLQPPLTKTPRAKWNCPACATKSPRKRNRHTRKISEPSAPATPATEVGVGPSTPHIPTAASVLPTNGTTCSSTPQTPAHTSSPHGTISPEPPEESAIIASLLTTAANGPQALASAPTTPKKEKAIKKKDLKDLSTCKAILGDLEGHEDAWPFLLPVNTRQFPTYKKIIKKPSDLSTIRKKLEDSIYKTREDYSEDIQLMFNNCEVFNEDDSPVGKAGHNLRSFFQAKWNDSFPPT